MENIETTIIYKEKIIWFLGDEKVGESHLPSLTMGGERDWLAFRQGVREYNRFEFVGADGTRYDSNSQTRDGIKMGEFSGKQYSERIKNGYFK